MVRFEEGKLVAQVVSVLGESVDVSLTKPG